MMKRINLALADEDHERLVRLKAFFKASNLETALAQAIKLAYRVAQARPDLLVEEEVL